MCLSAAVFCVFMDGPVEFLFLKKLWILCFPACFAASVFTVCGS